MNLIIVESPTKARTISRFLDKKNFKVESSFGHIRDLPTNKLGVNTRKDYEPEYIIPEKAEKRVRELKKLAQKADKIILATDEDREGEAIAWHLLYALGIKETQSERIAFHEITKNAILKAMENPRKIDLALVDAQQARRVLDRLVGYKLSPFLWRKIRKGLSAGRVQSVAVRLIVEREREIEKFKKEEYWEIQAELRKDNHQFLAKLWKKNNKPYKKLDINNKEQTEKIKNFLEKADYQVVDISQKEISKNPPAPFTTSTLQQSAYNAFGFSAKQTMRLAQQLYEGVPLENGKSTGLITYMRTDSLNLSKEALTAAAKKIKELFGEKYALKTPRFYKNKSKGAQEAHEAIRPTFISKDPQLIKDYLDPRQFKLYNLIWNRTVACQMSPAKIDLTVAEISARQKDKGDFYMLKAIGSVIKFDGYLRLINSNNKEDKILPPLNVKNKLSLNQITADQKFTQPPARYSEATLVKALEENGIGRPSTYAPIISTVQDRGYIEKDENKKLFPTEIGFLVNDLLVEHFKDIVDYKFTAEIEEKLDKIADGKEDWKEVIKNFYKPFLKNLEEKSREVKKSDFQTKLDRRCPECGGELVEKFGRFGKFIACLNYPNCKYTEKSAEDQTREKEIIKQEGNENGDIICEKCGAKMEVKNGPYGMFLGCGNYPKCKNIRRIENKIGVKCPKCGGDIIQRRSKKGRLFYGCNNYPKCDFVLWAKPTGERCPKCQSLLVYGPKETIRCSNKECAYTKEA
jgi:DNA topoisomerase-1